MEWRSVTHFLCSTFLFSSFNSASRNCPARAIKCIAFNSQWDSVPERCFNIPTEKERFFSGKWCQKGRNWPFEFKLNPNLPLFKRTKTEARVSLKHPTEQRRKESFLINVTPQTECFPPFRYIKYWIKFVQYQWSGTLMASYWCTGLLIYVTVLWQSNSSVSKASFSREKFFALV